jgi:hypothetical protein
MGLAEADNLCSVKTLYITPIIPHKIGIERIVLKSNIGIVIRITHRSYTNTDQCAQGISTKKYLIGLV